MVMEVSRAEYVADGTFKQQLSHRESSTSNAEPSSSGASECLALIQVSLFASKIVYYISRLKRY